MNIENISTPPIGLIAGKGLFPLLFAQEAHRNKRNLVVITLKEEMTEDMTPYAKIIYTISVSKLDSIINALKKEGVQQAVMAGKVEHTQLFSELIPDFRAAKLLFKIKDGRADSILKAVADEFLKEGIELLPSTTFLKNLIPNTGILTKRKPTDSEQKNIEFGIKMAQGLAALDLGQTVVVKSRTVVAVEAMEGTDQCIRRAGQIGGQNIIIVKSAKPNQDLRFDVPIIGLNTLRVMNEVNAKVLAIQADKTIILEKEQCIHIANQSEICIVAWNR